MNDGCRNVFRLRQALGPIGFAFVVMDAFLHRGCRAPRIDAHDSDAVGVYFLADAVGHRFEGMFGRGILTDIRTGRQPGAGIDKHNLALAAFEKRQEGLRQ